MVGAAAVLGLLTLMAAEGPFLKGQLHLHSSRSGDSSTAPRDVVKWYESRGYDFIVFTDHEHVTVESSSPAMLVLPGVELTQNSERCHPEPPPRMHCLLHVNALFVTPPAGGSGAVPWGPRPPPNRFALYRRALQTARALGGVAQLNHPNFHYAADAALISRLAAEGLLLLEIANEAWDSNNQPSDPGRQSTEALWDTVLSSGANVHGTATDDAHHYYDAMAVRQRREDVFPGDLGFVMVRAKKEAPAIRAAVERGDFYSSTGVFLARVDRSATTLDLEVAARSAGPHHFQFIGRHGKILAHVQGRTASFPLAKARGGYVRAVISDAEGRRAWTQPIRVP